MLPVQFFVSPFVSPFIVDGRHMYTWMQVLFDKDSSSAAASGPRRALQYSQGHRCLGAGLCGSHLSR